MKKWINGFLTGLCCAATSVYAIDYYRMRLSADGYYWEKAEYPKKDLVLIDLQVAENEIEWDRMVRKKLPLYDPDSLGAFATIRTPDSPGPKGDECTVWIKDPEWIYEPEFIGHELLHCFYGNWHKRQDRSKR